jgi:hypothetical protein
MKDGPCMESTDRVLPEKAGWIGNEKKITRLKAGNSLKKLSLFGYAFIYNSLVTGLREDMHF